MKGSLIAGIPHTGTADSDKSRLQKTFSGDTGRFDKNYPASSCLRLATESKKALLYQMRSQHSRHLGAEAGP